MDWRQYTELTLYYEDLLEIFLVGVKCCHYHSVIQKIPLLYAWKQQF